MKISIHQYNLGCVLIVTYHGELCGVELGTNPHKLLYDFMADNKLYKAGSVSDANNPSNVVDQVIRIVNGENMQYSLPIMFSNMTTFQSAVIFAIKTIPFGQVKSYQEIAAQIGRPKAYRAVGTACGNNKLAVIVPCHRVIPASGKIGNYRWGAELKQKLLEREGAI